MDGSFDSQSRNFGELVGQYEPLPITVPQFQRGYSWEKSHVATFWEDLRTFHSEVHSRSAAERYFLGPIVILPEQDRITLLDGQQRLATATILFSVLRDIARKQNPSGRQDGNDLARDIQTGLIAKGDSRFSLELGETDNTFFLKTIQEDPGQSEKALLRSHRLIKSAKEYLTEAVLKEIDGLDSLQAIEKLKVLRDTLASRVTMVAISVRSEDDAFNIFETLNDRGLRLSVPDLLLNYLMRTATAASDRKRIREKWNTMLEKMGPRDIDRFFRHMWLSKYGDVKARGLFREIKDFLEQQRIRSVEFADACGEECDHYVALMDLDPSVLRDALQDVTGLTKYLGVSSCLPLLLSGLRCLTPPHFARLAKMTAGLVVRHSLVVNLNPSDLENAFYSAAREIRAGHSKGETSAKCLHKAKSILAEINPMSGQVEAAATDLVLTRSEARYVITTLANVMQTSTKEIAIDDATLEHVFPLNPSADWGDTTNLEPLVWSIGNLTILGSALNRAAANAAFERKRVKIYLRSEIKMTKTLARYHKRWTAKEVYGRAQSLAKLIVQTWEGPRR